MKKDFALFFDIDGTLCDPKTSKIPTSAIDEIRNWQSLGYRCCIATGRCKSDATKKDVGKYHWDGFIAANGQEVYGPNDVLIHKTVMDQKIVEQALKVAKDQNRSLVLVTEEEWLLIGDINDDVRIAYELFGGNIPTPTTYKNQEVIYMIAFGPTQDSYTDYEKLGLKAATSYYHYADLVLPGFDKAQGIQSYLKHEGIPKYYAFGDSGNDLEMLQNADKAFVMGNGDPLLFQYADEVAPPVDQDGLATILKKLRLENEER